MDLIQPAAPDGRPCDFAVVLVLVRLGARLLLFQRIHKALDAVPAELTDHAPLQPRDNAADVADSRALGLRTREGVAVLVVPRGPCLTLFDPVEHTLGAVAVLILCPVFKRLVAPDVAARSPDFGVVGFQRAHIPERRAGVLGLLKAGFFRVKLFSRPPVGEGERLGLHGTDRAHRCTDGDRLGLGLVGGVGQRRILEALVGCGGGGGGSEHGPACHAVQAAVAAFLESIDAAEVVRDAIGAPAQRKLGQRVLNEGGDALELAPVNLALFLRCCVVGAWQPHTGRGHTEGGQDAVAGVGTLAYKLHIPQGERGKIHVEVSGQDHRRPLLAGDLAVGVGYHVLLLAGNRLLRLENGAWPPLVALGSRELRCGLIRFQVVAERTNQALAVEPLCPVLPACERDMHHHRGVVDRHPTTSGAILVGFGLPGVVGDDADALGMQDRQAHRAAGVRSGAQEVGVAGE